MIKSFADKRTERIFTRDITAWPSAALCRKALRKLLQIEGATGLNDLRVPPSNHLEKLKGDRKGQHSIMINDQWRICFTWRHPHAHNVEVNKHYRK
jgi:toxin HigB-1